MNFKLKTDNKSVREYLFFIGVLLLVILPKGGFKVAGIPITWGYLYLGFLFLLISYMIVLKDNHFFNRKHLICYFASLPFVVYLIAHICTNGYIGTIGNLISYLISFVFLPFLFYIYLPHYLNSINQDYIDKIISKAVVLVSVYGIILFFIKYLFDYDFEVPYITINSGDVGEVADKYNDRGGVSKLISTYNNGNIFGVSILMFFPVFFTTSKSKFKKTIVIVALILTLSRTVWLGMIFFFLIYYRKKFFKLIKAALILLLFSSLFSLIFFAKDFQYGSLSGFVLDGRFGGRIIQIKKSIADISFFGSYSFDSIVEIVYLSIIKQLGVLGLLLFCLSFFTPIYIYFISKHKKNINYILGTLVYLFVCLSDGAMTYIPTLCFFYFVTGIGLLNKNRA